jgi:hypothetical protein
MTTHIAGFAKALLLKVVGFSHDAVMYVCVFDNSSKKCLFLQKMTTKRYLLLDGNKKNYLICLTFFPE